jgi:hypothetical protein
MFGGELLK